jgi:RNA polymerase sigma-70 factor (ECF subfamily)
VETTVDLTLAFRQRRAVTEAPEPGQEADAGLAEAARAGDTSAFGQLYARYARMVHGILLARVPPAEVDDLVQEVFLQAWRRIGSLREAAAFGGWLATITRNRATDFHRRSEETTELPDALPTAPAGSGRVAEARAALEAIKSLPDAYRESLLLRLVEGMTGPEIAARTGLTPDSVRVNLHRGMKLLREKLGRKDTHA